MSRARSPRSSLPKRQAGRISRDWLRPFARMWETLFSAGKAMPVPLVEEYEPRLLYSADVAPDALILAGSTHVFEQRLLAPDGEFTDSATAHVPRHEIVFVDTATPDYQTLVDDIRRDGHDGRTLAVVMIDGASDGIQQITETLAARKDVSAIHIIAHGSDGAVYLGQSVLDSDFLAQNGDQIARWSSALTEDADLLIYGCDVAGSESGQALIDALSRLTGADVNASEDVTGAALLGGNWVLEYRTGGIETGVFQSSWQGLLGAVPSGAETLVNTTLAPMQTEAAVAMGSNGNYVVAWSSDTNQDGDGSGIFARLYDAAGNAISAEFRVNTYTASSQAQPSAAMDSNGNFVIVWASDGQDGNSFGVYAQRYSAAGVAQGTEFRVNVTTTNSQDQPAVAMDSSGNFVVAWQSTHAGRSDIYARRFDAAGTALSGEFQVNSVTPAAQSLPTVAMNASGAFVIGWNNLNGILGQLYNAAGSLVGGEFSVNTSSGASPNRAAAAMAPDGSFVITWFSGKDAKGTGVFAQRFSAAGAKQGSEIHVNTTTLNDQDFPSVAIDGLGNFTIAWQSNNQDGGGTGIYMQRYEATGLALGFETRVNSTTANDQALPAIGMRPSGDFVVAWNGNGPGDTAGIFAQRYLYQNAAPVLTPAAPTLTALTEDQTNNAGQTVASIVGASIGDVDAGALEGIAITALVGGNGTWQYSVNGGGTWAVVGAVSDTSGLLLRATDFMRFEPDRQNATAASITYRAWDQTSGTPGTKLDASTHGGASAFSSATDTAGITVNAVNDAPVNAVPGAQSTALNTLVVFSTGNGNAISIGDVDAGSNPLELTLSVSHGTLAVGGTTGLTFSAGTGTGDATMTFRGTVANINAALDGLRYDPNPGYSGSDHLDVTADDLGNTGTGGAQIVTNTFAINVDFVNLAPVLSGATNLTAINEDPATIPGTLVSALIAGQVNDVDVDALAGITVTAVDNSNGAWQYSVNGGSSWNAFGSPSAAAARLLAADANTYVRFVPNADFNGTVANGLTFRAWDRTSGTAGGTADTTSSANTLRDDFGAGSYSNNNGSAAWASDWIDVDGNPAAGNIQITGGQLILSSNLNSDSIYREADLSGAASATLAFNYDNQLLLGLGSVILEASNNGGGSYTTLATFSASINTGSGAFSTDIGAYIAANARIRFSVAGVSAPAQSLLVDDVQISYVTPLNGGTTAFSSATASASITVNAVNDAPVLAGANNLAAIDEDPAANPGTLVSALIAGQVSEVDSGALAGIAVTAVVNTNGTWEYSVNGGGAWSAFGGPSGAAARLLAADASTYVRFVPNANFNGTVTNGLTFRAWDRTSGTAGDPADTTANGGTTGFSSATASASITVNAVNDAPAGTGNTVTVLEDGGHIFSLADFGFTDLNDNPANGMLAVRITTLPAAGTLINNGVDASAGQFISTADIAAGLLVFAPAPNGNGTGYASFTFQVQDDGSGADLDSTARTMSVDVTAVTDAPVGVPAITGTVTEDQVLTADTSGISDADGLGVFSYQWLRNGGAIAGALASTYTPGHADVGTAISVQVAYTDGNSTNETVTSAPTAAVANVNDAPVGASNTATVLEDGSHTFSLGDFGFWDAEGDSLMKVRVTALPSQGALTLDGITVVWNQEILSSDIVAGKFHYLPSIGTTGIRSDALMFQVHDGAVYSAASYALTLTIIPVPELLAVAPPTPGPAPVVQEATPAPAATNQPAAAASEKTVARNDSVAATNGPEYADTPAAATAIMGAEPVEQGVRLSTDGAERASTPRAGSYGSSALGIGAIVPVVPVNLAQFSLVQVAAMLNFSATESVLDASRNRVLGEALDRLRDSLITETAAEQHVMASGVAVGTGLSVGYVVWLLRGGVLLTSLLSSLPAWRFVDPLPVLGRLKEDKDDGEEDESLESMVSTARDEPHATTEESPNGSEQVR